MKSIKSTISKVTAEGVINRNHKVPNILLASCDETTDHLETLFETESLTDKDLYDDLHETFRTRKKIK